MENGELIFYLNVSNIFCHSLYDCIQANDYDIEIVFLLSP